MCIKTVHIADEGRVCILAPFALRAAAVQTGESITRHGGDNAHDASLTAVQLGLSHVRHGTDLAVVHGTVAVRCELVKHRIAHIYQGLTVLLHIASLSFFDKGRQGSQAGIKVGVAHSDQGPGKSWPAANGGVYAAEVQHEAILGAVKSTVHGFQGSVLLQLLGRYGGCLNVAPLSVVVILHGVVGVQGHLVKCEAGGVVYGVRPGHVPCKTNADPRQTLQ